MRLTLTPEMLEGAYELLRTTAPFKSWHLPDGETVSFQVTGSRKTSGLHFYERGQHAICVSQNNHRTLRTLLEVVAHEMVHMYETKLGLARSDVEHSTRFKELAKRVCAYHGFDPGTF
jgi:hypothetical protein